MFQVNCFDVPVFLIPPLICDCSALGSFRISIRKAMDISLHRFSVATVQFVVFDDSEEH